MVPDSALVFASSTLAVGVALFAFTAWSTKAPLSCQTISLSKVCDVEDLRLADNGKRVGYVRFWQWWFKSDTRNEDTCNGQGDNVAVVNQGAHGLLAAIGNTPLIRINSLSDATGCEILGKCEFLNPGGSVKDRVAVKIIQEGLSSGQLKPGGLVCEGSAGSTGVSLALAARAFGCRCFVALPDDAAIEKSQMLEALGAHVERVRPVAITHPGHFVNVARRKAQEVARGGGIFKQESSKTANATRAADSMVGTGLKCSETAQHCVIESAMTGSDQSNLPSRRESTAAGFGGEAGFFKPKKAKGRARNNGPKFLSDGSASKARKAKKKQLAASREMTVSRPKRGPDSEARIEAESVELDWGEPWFGDLVEATDEDESVSGIHEDKVEGDDSVRQSKSKADEKAKSELPRVVNGGLEDSKAGTSETENSADLRTEGLREISRVAEEADGLGQQRESPGQQKDGVAGSINPGEAKECQANGSRIPPVLFEENGNDVSDKESVRVASHRADVSVGATRPAVDVSRGIPRARESPATEAAADQAQKKNDDVRESKVDVSGPPNVTSSAGSSSSGFFADQFENLANFRAHYEGTGPEIWAQTKGKIDAFVAGAGTGGTLAGVSCFLTERDADVKCYLVDPPGSGLYYKVTRGVLYTPQEAEGKRLRNPFDTITEGIGINRLTRNFEKAKLDGAFRATDQEAVDMARYLLLNDGIFVGSSSAVNCVGAFRAAKALGPGHVIVTILCDGGQRHLSKFHNPEYLKTHCLTPSEKGSLPLT